MSQMRTVKSAAVYNAPDICTQARSQSQQGGFLPPPPGLIPTHPAPSATNTDWEIPSLTEASARQAFLEYAMSRRCYGTPPAREINIESEVVDSPACGVAPQPWDIPVQLPTLFTDSVHKVIIPHTSSLRPCQKCTGVGLEMCTTCHGVGQVRCWTCNGTGRQMQMEMCHMCYGNGIQSCHMCTSRRPPICMACHGKGQFLHYLQLTVTWKNDIFEYVSDHKSEFPTILFKKANGQKIFMEEQLLLSPLQNFPEVFINQASQNGLQQHQLRFASSSRILRQRQTIEWLPLTRVDYNWKGQHYNFFVFGREHKVHTFNYPVKCCCAVM
ncbi:protein SSUH2 homolog [Discoglossus pictus]